MRDFRFSEFGERTRAPLMLIHGGMLDRRSWARQQELADQFRLITPDLPGHGLNRQAQKTFCVDSAAHELVELLDYARAEGAYVLGFSLGGMVAQRMAEIASDRLAGVILYACPLIAHFRGMFARDLVAFMATLDSRLRSWSSIKNKWATLCTKDVAGQFDVLRAMSLLEVGDYQNMFKALVHAVRWDPEYRIPISSAYFWGTEDVRMANVPKLAGVYRSLYGDSCMTEFPGAGHCVHWEMPALFNSAVIHQLAAWQSAPARKNLFL